MRKEVIVLARDEEHSRDLCALLEREKYRTVAVNSLKDLHSCIDHNLTLALFLDLDLIPMDNKTLRELRMGYRELCIIGLSSRSFHPELKESLSRYVDACFSKPVDLDAVLYYLKGAQAIHKTRHLGVFSVNRVSISSRRSMGMEEDQGNVRMESPAIGPKKRKQGRKANQDQAERRRLLQKVLLGAAALASGTAALGGKARASSPDIDKDTARPLGAPHALAEGNILERMRHDLQRALKKPVSERKWVMVIDQQKCIGCCACNISCNTENNLPPGVVYRPVLRQEVGKYPNVGRIFTPRPCMHCDTPPCVPVCPVRATWKREDGIVVIDYDVCIGCRNCLLACPYGARTSDFGEFYGMSTPEIMPYETRPNYEYSKEWRRKPYRDDSPVGNARKCQFCLHRLREGMLPACVTTCLGGATYFGDYNDKASLVHKVLGSSRVRQLKPELGTQPSVFYLT